MKRRKRMWLWVMGGLAAVLALLLTLMLVLPRLINLAPIKEKLLANISQAVGGKVACQTLDLAFLPRPRVLVREGSLSIPGKVDADIESLTLYPKILALLVAEVKIATLRIEAPVFTVKRLEGQLKNQKKLELLSAEIIEQRMASLLDSVASKAPGLVVLLKNGSFNLFQGNRPVLSLEDIEGRIVLPSRTIKIDLACKSDLWESLSLKAWWDFRNSQRNRELRGYQAPPLVSLEVEGKGVNADATREAAITLAGDMGVIKNIFRVVQSGKVPHITVNVQGDRIADLKKKENIVIAGSMVDGEVSVPEVDLDLEEVAGEMLISEGILQGSNLEARWRNALGRHGRLKLGLTGRNAPFHLDVELEADLAQLRAFLEQRIRKESFVEETRRIDALEGRGTGRLIMGESLGSIKTRVVVSEFKLSANYRRVPYALKIAGGRFSYDETGIDVENLSGKVGGSSFSELSGELTWGEEPYLELKAAGSKILLEEIYPWLISFKAIGSRLRHLSFLQGVVELYTPSLKGPLLRPGSWHFDTKGEVKRLAIETSLVSGPIEIAKGRFHAIEDGTKQELSFTDAQITMLDASLEGSGVLKGYVEGLNGVDLRLEGNMRSESIRWLSGVIRIPPALKPRSPLNISRGHLVWDRNAATSFAGDLVVQKAAKITIDILKDDKELHIRNMLIQDQDTSAGLKLDVTRMALNLEFSGYLTKATMGRLFERKQAAQGWVEGNILIHILTEDPMKSKAQGSLKGGNLFLPLNVKAPLEIDSISLDAKKSTVKVNSADFMWEDNRLALEGEVHFSPEGLQLDMDLSAKDVYWETIANAFYQNSETEKDKVGELLRGFPLRGKLRFHAEHFRYDPFIWTPFHADIAFKQNAIDIAISKADLCSIATPGTLRVTPQHMTLDFKPVSTDQDLDATFACLSGKKNEMTGVFDLAGEITAQEKPEALLNSLLGNLEFVAKDGRIYRYGLLAKVLAFVNLTEVFRGKVPDLTKEGFAYHSMEAKATIQDGKLMLKEALIDAPSMGIVCHGHIDFTNKTLDLKYLVAPLKTVDSVIKKIPLVGRILRGTLVSVPVKVEGPWANPRVTALSPSAVGSGLLGIMENTLKLPVEIIESLPSGEKPE